MTKSNIRLQDSALQIVRVLKQTARANELAVQQFTAQLLNTRALEGSTLQQITEVENELSLLQGKYPAPVSRDTLFFTMPLPALAEAGVPFQLLGRRPDIRQAALELEAAKADVAAARAAFYPSLSLTPYMGFLSSMA
ncbi:MAG: TolC family protein [Williamsia sp.]|nr:TolC family protein [Williamsia sp.]